MRKSTVIVDKSANSPTIMGESTEGLTPDEIQGVWDTLHDARAVNTRKSYKKAWEHFEKWCRQREESFEPLRISPNQLVTYLNHLRDIGRSMSSIGIFLAAYAYVYEFKGIETCHNTMLVKRARKGLRNKILPERPPVAKQAMTIDILVALLAVHQGDDLAAVRARAMLLLGFTGGWRRSELVGIEMRDISRDKTRMWIRLRKAKNDQTGEQRQAKWFVRSGGPLCPVTAVELWLERAGVKAGPLFRRLRGGVPGQRPLSPGWVAKLIKTSCQAAGIPHEDFSGHSLRSGFATTALNDGFDLAEVQKQTGHALLDSLVRYDQRSRRESTIGQIRLPAPPKNPSSTVDVVPEDEMK